MAGYTLALDLKYNQKNLKLFNFLDNMIVEMGGRHYLAKDARMSTKTFKATYNNWQKFQDVRKKYNALGIFSSNQSIRIGLD
jgi:FAD/FMN-containing dehydrogenase